MHFKLIFTATAISGPRPKNFGDSVCMPYLIEVTGNELTYCQVHVSGAYIAEMCFHGERLTLNCGMLEFVPIGGLPPGHE